jgi:cysteine-rich repeat protein
MRWCVVLLTIVSCGREGDVPCNGVLEPGELCDDGNAHDGDGCDCATRMIAPAAALSQPAVPVVLVEDGGWCWFQDERVIEHDGHLVVSTISHGGDIQVTHYDPATGARSHSILHTRLERDDHDVASLLALPDGKVAAYYTRHDGFEHLFSRAGDPADPMSWAPVRVTNFGYDVTYTNPFFLDQTADRVHMFIRGEETNPTLLVSDTFGSSWSGGSQLLDSGERELDGRVFDHRPYVKYASDGRRVHLLYTDGHPAEFKRNSIYHLMYDGSSLRQSDGTRVAVAGPDEQPKLAPERGTLVYDGTALGGQAWTWDAAVDADGAPVVVFSTFPDPQRSYFDHRYHYARWDGTSWQLSEIAYGGTGIYPAEGFYSGGIALDPDDPTIVYFASNVVPTTGDLTPTGVFEIYRGVTADRGATWTISAVTSNSRVHNLRPIVPAQHTAPTTLVWMRGSYDTYLDYHMQTVGLLGDAAAVAATPVYQDPGLPAIARFDLASTASGCPTPAAPGFAPVVPAAGRATAVDGGVSLTVYNITATREAVTTDPLYRGLVVCSRGGFDPVGKLRVTLRWLEPDTDYVVRLYGHDTADAYGKPTLWFRGDATTLDSDDNAAFLTGHRNVNNLVAGEGYTEVILRSDAEGAISVVGRGLDYAGDDRTAVLSAVEVLRPPPTELVARFDVDAAPGVGTAPGATSLSFDDSVEWSGEATASGITVRVTSDRIGALHARTAADPLLADFIDGRDQLAVDVSGLEPGRLYAFTVYSTDLDHNLYAASRWRVEEPGHEPIVVHDFHMNLHRADAGAAFTFFHRASTTSFRLRGEDVITSLSTNPSLVIFNGLDIAVAPEVGP